jgi:serine/threonine protein kinase
MAFPEDSLLMSANLCRWVIDFQDVDVGEQIGMGSYGVVYRGKWKSIDVAIKKFINQKLDERRMLEFRAEMALLSQLQHPNVVLFIGNALPPQPHTYVHVQRSPASYRDRMQARAPSDLT